ncbi:hypothetical protein M3649_19185 [Ureibacillus chungkukjangi]|uniref:hypothetical protein n=1 Tax=Ureibacillus chungkukjangi TaxID=1202712 RepID=UPI002041E91B|nr:hypothetical protein [Ureibacillus chungkukjangi]MCM3390225.1 hypothetical protein [Ureibacillus chungkukjangi]
MIDITYFNELKEQIINKEKWDKDCFHVFDYEAGSGKSRNCHKYIAEMTQNYGYRVLYVQRFVKENLLNETVYAINEHAGKNVAIAFTGEESKIKERREVAKKAQVICISHKMYIQICKGSHPGLIDNRNILIIDEFPDLLEKVSLTEEDIGYLWFSQHKYHNPLLDEFAQMLRDSFSEYSKQTEVDLRNQLIYMGFEEQKYEIIKLNLPDMIERTTENKDKELLKKCYHILNNGCFFYENKLHTYNKIEFAMLENNIILDANGFDYRYSLTKKFHVRHQPKFFNYAHSTFRHFEVNTSKKELSKQINIYEKILDQITLNLNEKTLFITDQENQTKLEEKIAQYLSSRGLNDAEIAEIKNEKIKVDYFGNIIGVNYYRDFNNVVVVKTPNYDYLTYALTYLYFRSKDDKQIENVEIFKHETVENIRISIVAGEIYQAIKRINRDNSRKANFYVFTTNQEAVDLILKQLPGIQFKKDKLSISSKKKASENKATKFEQQVEKVKKMIIEWKNSGRESVKKKEIRERLVENNKEIDKGNFSRIINACQTFLEINGIKSEGQKIIFNKK